MRKPELRPQRPRFSGITAAPLNYGDDLILIYDLDFQLLNPISQLGDGIEFRVWISCHRRCAKTTG